MQKQSTIFLKFDETAAEISVQQKVRNVLDIYMYAT